MTSLATIDRIASGPAPAQPHVDGQVSRARYFRPLKARSGHAFDRDLDRSPFVPGLLRSSRPSTVLGSVVPVVIGSVDGVLGRRCEIHIVEEAFKGVPSLADGDSSPPIVGKARGFRVGTTLSHVGPSGVFLGFRKPVSTFDLRRNLPAQTPAALGVFASEMNPLDRRLSAALAAAEPQSLPIKTRSFSLKDGQPSKHVAAHVDRFHYTPKASAPKTRQVNQER